MRASEIAAADSNPRPQGWNFKRSTGTKSPTPLPLCDASPEALAASVTMFARRKDQCQWPLGEPDGAQTRYCGGPRTQCAGRFTSPYCEGHAARAFTARPVKPVDGALEVYLARKPCRSRSMEYER